MTETITPPQAAGLDKRRYRKVRRFFLGVLFHILWWDILLNRPGLRWLRPPALPRWRRTARRFRALALEMGGVLIKLGQFLSIRVDILPVEITRELAGLQDKVPPEPAEAVMAQIVSDFGKPLTDLFQHFSPTPLGAASLAQAHSVILASGEPAVLKVLRPGIDVTVETDLAALRLALKWLKSYRKLRKRVDLDWLAREFTEVTRRELDLKAEGRNAERLARDFEGDERMYIPRIFWEYSAARTLALEDVSYIKIADLKGIQDAGIAPSAVADTLYNLYMSQVFETYFVHVDPHPGNLFVRPLPTGEEKAGGREEFTPGEPVPFQADRPFQIVFIDFGMMTPIPSRLRSALREYVVGLGTRDAEKIVQAYVRADTLLPGADLQRIIEAHEAIFSRFWGVHVSRLKDVALKEADGFMAEYRDLIREAPFQVQVDMLFTVRAIGILSGMAANLDPDFDVWTKTIPYARKFAADSIRKDGFRRLKALVEVLEAAFRLPTAAGSLLNRLNAGRLTLPSALSSEDRRQLTKLRHSVRSLGWMVLTGALILAGAVLYAGGAAGRVWGMPVLLSLISLMQAVHRDS